MGLDTFAIYHFGIDYRGIIGSYGRNGYRGRLGAGRGTLGV